MTPDEQKMLRETFELSRENNEILKKLYRSTVLGRIVRFLYWLIIIGITVGSFYFIQPYLDSFQDAYGQIRDTQSQFGDLFGIGG